MPEASRSLQAHGSRPSPPPLTGLILAGGQAQRMQGQDKGLLLLQDQPLVVHVLQRLQAQVQRVLINANRNTQHYAQWAPVVADAPDLPVHAGPLVGVASGLRASPTPWLLCVPCDGPDLPLDLASRLWQALSHSTDSAPADRPVPPDEQRPHVATVRAGGRRQGVFLLLNQACLPALEAWLLEGGRKVGLWLDQMQAVEAEWPDAQPFANLNTPADLAAAAQRNQASKG